MKNEEDLFAQGPECDFCKVTLDKDEELQPLYVGEMPQPKPHYLSEVASRDGDGINNVREREFRLLGKPIGIYSALYEAVRNCDDIEVNESMRVEEVQAVGGETQYADLEHGSVPSTTQFESRTRDDKVGISLKIHPNDIDYEPDAMICEDCGDMFENL